MTKNSCFSLIYTFSVLFVLPLVSAGQAHYETYHGPPVLPSWTTENCHMWEKRYTGSSDSWMTAMDQASNGGFIMAGYTVLGDITKTIVIEVDNTGNKQWEKVYGGQYQTSARSIKQTPVDGGYILAGYTETIDRATDFWILKLDVNGNMLWQKTLGGSSFDEAYSVIQTNDNGYLVTGTTYSDDGDVTGGAEGTFKYWIVRLDSAGDLIWQKKLETRQRPYSVKQTTDGGFIIASDSPYYFNQGHPEDPTDEGAFCVVKLNASGDFQWQVTLGTHAPDAAFDVILTDDGHYVAAGFTSDFTPSENHNGFVVKISGSGQVVWQTQIDYSERDHIKSIRQTADGGFMFSGSTDYRWNNRYGTFDLSDIWAGKLDANGQLVWQGALGGYREDEALSIVPADDGSYAIGATSASASGGEYGLLLIKLEPGCAIQQRSGRYRMKGNIAYAFGGPSDRKSPASVRTNSNTTFVFKDILERLMATVSSGGDSPVGGDVTVTAWVDIDQSPGYVRRHYEIMPDDAATTATATITLYFSQEDFDAYNRQAGNDRQLPTAPDDAAGNDNFRIVKYGGISNTENGEQASYSGSRIVIGPENYQMVWNDYEQIWEVTFDVKGFSGFFATDAVTADSSLPVAFATLGAFLSEGMLTVNWTVANETNNAYYLVETSIDGKNFETVSHKILSKAKDGNSSSVLNYSFTKSYSLLHGMAAFLFLAIGLGRRSRKLATGIAITACLILALSCREPFPDGEEVAGKLYVRIVQVDADGSRSYSRIIIAKP